MKAIHAALRGLAVAATVLLGFAVAVTVLVSMIFLAFIQGGPTP